MLSAAADEYERVAGCLHCAEGLDGVTGSERYWLFSAVDSVAARVRAVTAEHRAMAAALTHRANVAASDQVSPIFAGLAVAASGLAPATVSFDRDGDGVHDTVAVDQDGDGYFETFVLDRQQDGVYDMILVTDAGGNLVGAGFDDDQDAHMESFVGARPGGGVWASDPNRDGAYELSVIGGARPGLAPAPAASGGGYLIGGSNGGWWSEPTVGGTGSGGYLIGGSNGGWWSEPPVVSTVSGSNIVGGPNAWRGPGPGEAWTAGALAGYPGSRGFTGFDGGFDNSVFDNPGVRQPELGAADTYDWTKDPKLDTNGNGVGNAFDPDMFGRG